MNTLDGNAGRQLAQTEAAIDAGLEECERLIKDLHAVGDCAVLLREPDGTMAGVDFTSARGERLKEDISKAVDALRLARQQIESVGRS